MAGIDVDELVEEVMKELRTYEQTTVGNVENAVEKTAKETVAELKQTSPKKTGKYAKSWAKKNAVTGRSNFESTIYSKKPKYRLTHLLEKGHQKRNGGRVEGIPHIKKAEEHAIAKLEERIFKGL